MSQLGCVDSQNKSHGQKEGPWRQVPGISLGQVAVAHCLRIASLLETFRAQEKESKRTYMPEEGTGERCRCAQGRVHTGCFVLWVFISFLQTGILGEVSGEDLSRVFISFPGMSFNMLMHQNEHIEH